MKKLFLTLVVLIAVFLPAVAAEEIDAVLQKAAEDISARITQQTILGIMDFDSSTKRMSTYISESLIGSFYDNPHIRLVTRLHMDKINEELGFQNSGYVSDETALSVCKRLGAQVIVFGRIDEFNNSYSMQVTMLDVESATYALFKKYDIARSPKTEQLLQHSATVYKSSIGCVAEANKNSISHIAPAGGILFDYNFGRRCSIGIKALVSGDVFEKDNSIYTIEPLFLLRWYAVSPTGEPNAGIFLEGLCGPDLLFVNSSFKTTLSAGLALGARIPARSLYVEPALRGGYPYLFGVSLAVGWRL